MTIKNFKNQNFQFTGIKLGQWHWKNGEGGQGRANALPPTVTKEDIAPSAHCLKIYDEAANRVLKKMNKEEVNSKKAEQQQRLHIN